MADFNPIEAPAATKPTVKRNKNAHHACLRRNVSAFTLAGQGVGDRLMLPKIPVGAKGVRFRIQSSVTLGATATLALGVAGNTGKYRAAAVLNTTNAEDVSSAVNTAAELAADESPFLTVGAAALPGAGTLVVETLYTV